MKKTLPIGIFDSGVGGLTVAHAITQLLPHEEIIYFGDTAHLPYGDKSAEAIRAYSAKITEFLLHMQCKMIVIACNTASSAAFRTVQKIAGNRAPVINVIDPVADYVTKGRYNKVGVIGTKRTIGSHIYPKKIKEKKMRMEVVSCATPLLVPMIEEGFFNNKISQTIINDYLSRPKLAGIDALILGCTHFPLIQPEIEKYYKGKVKIIDSASIVALSVKAALTEHKLLNNVAKPHHHFYISDFTPSFEHTARMFFMGSIRLEHYNIWA